MTDSLECKAAALLYQVACDLETEVKGFSKSSSAVEALERWREMDVSLTEYRDLQRTMGLSTKHTDCNNCVCRR